MSDLTPYNTKIVDQHTQQAEGYARLTQSVAATDRRAALRNSIAVRPDDTLLDVACGPGSLTLDLAPHLAHATGLDITAAMLEQARQAQADLGIANVEWVEGDAASIPFANEHFGIVSCSAAFHHFEQPAAVLREMARVCHPGGRVVVIDVTPNSDKAAAYDRMERMRDPSHGHAHSLAQFAELGVRVGLGSPESETSFAGPMPFEAVLATSHPEGHSREELLGIMRSDALTGMDELGFCAEIRDGSVHVTYQVSSVCWTKPAPGKWA